MLGPPDPHEGPPYTFVVQFPEVELDEDGNPVQPYRPLPPALTVTGVTHGRQHEDGPLEVPAPFRRLTVADLSDERRPGCYWPLTDPE